MLEGPILLGVGILLFGLVFVLLVWSLLRVVPRWRPINLEPASQSFVQIKAHEDAILIVETGGRVRYINAIARDWFDLVEGETPNIERLARRVRPGDNFLELCATEGQARFSVNGRLVDAISYRVPGEVPALLVAIRRTDPALGLAAQGQEILPGTALKTVSEFGQSIASNLSLEDTVKALLVNVERLVASDFLEVKVWDEAAKVMIPYRMGDADGAARPLQREQLSQFGEYAGFLISERRELFIPDTRSFSEVRFDPVANRVPPMGSYIGIPLVAYGQLVGTLEVGVVVVNGFSSDDLSVLQLVTGQAAVALRNAGLYEVQKRWNAQLFGLTNLSQTVGSLRDLRDLFARLVDGLSPLFNVEILGFLLYDEQRRALEGQKPFHGLPNNVVQIYKTAIRPNSVAEKRILGQDIITSMNASQDPVWGDLGLQDIAQAASMKDTALIPLLSAGRFLGYLQLSNHRQSSQPISQEELRLLNIVANQVAAIIDNALLVQQARQRNQRAEAMRRIASLVSSPATLDEILNYSLQEVGQILQADMAAIFLLDESEGVMRAHLSSVFGVPVELRESLSRLNVKPSAFRMTVAGSQRSFVSSNLSKDRRILPLYRALVRRLNIESAVVVPLVVRGQGIGEMMLGANRQDVFSNYDLQVASTVSSQLAVAIESARHSGETEDVLRRRAGYMTAMSRIARELNATSDLKELARITFDECLRLTEADCGSLVLFDREDSTLTQGVLFSLGHAPVRELTPMVQTVLKTGAPSLMMDLADLDAPHAGVLSQLVYPIRYQDENVGYIELHAATAGRLNDVSLEIVKYVGAQAAVSIHNAFKHREQQKRTEVLRRRADTLLHLLDTSRSLRPDQSLENVLEAIARGIQQATPFNVVLISLHNPETGMMTRVVGVGLEPDVFAQMQSHQQAWSSVSQLLKSDFEIGNVYFIPEDQAPIIPADVQMMTVVAESGESPNAWRADDMLMAPIYHPDGSPLGLISLDAPRDGQRPDQNTFDTLDAFITQAGFAISSGRNMIELRDRIQLLSLEVERQKNLVSFSQRSLPMLLHKDLEQTMSISNLNQRARHIRAGLQLTEAISRQIDSTTALLALGQQVLTSFDMSVALVARETADGPRIAHIMGNLPRGANPEALFGQRNPLRTCLQTGETILSMNLEDDEVWHDTPFLTALKAKSFICIPVIINGKTIAAVLATDTEAMPALSQEDRQVYFQISRQISIILQNISLLNETRQRLQEVNLLLDFSRHLSGLNPRDILRSLLDSSLRVIGPAHAGVVLLWDARDEILIPMAASNYVDDESVKEIVYHAGEGLPGRVFVERQPRRVDEVNFASDYNLPADNLLKYRKATGGRLPVSSLIVPIQTSDRNMGVLVLDNFNTPAAFRADDENLLLSLTQQVALSLENVRLMQATEERAGQLQALNAVAATLTSSLQRDDLVGSLLDRLGRVILFDTAILWLRNEDKMIIAEARGFDDSEERKGLSVDVEDSILLNEMTRTGQAIPVGDVRSDLRFSSLVEPRYLSWLGVPLIAKGQVIGVIAVEKTEPHYYNNELTQLATTFASQAAVAIDNANLFEESVRRAVELDERSQRLGLLNQFSAELGGSLNADQVLRLTANQMLKAMLADRAMVILLDKNNHAFLTTVLPDESGRPAMYRSLPDNVVLNRMRETLTVYACDDIGHDPDMDSLVDFVEGAASMLILPISSSQGLHVIAVQNSKQRHFTPTEIELARTIGNQATIALENADLFQSTLTTAERLVILNQVSYEISSSLDAEDIYQAINEAATKLMPVDAFIIALLDEEADEVDGVYIVDMGQRISGVRLPVGQGLSGQVIATGQPILTLQSSEVEERGGVTIGEKGTPHSIIAVPMLSGGKVIGALSAQSYQFNAYTENDQQILSTLANQATVAIQNSRLFAETQKLAATLEQRVVERTAELEREQRSTETLLRILTEVSASLDLDRALSRTLALLNDAIGAEQGTIMLVHPEDNLLHYRAGYGYVTDSSQGILRHQNGFKLKIGEGLAGWVVKYRQPVMVEDLFKDPRWVVSQSSQTHRSALVAPLIVGEDVIGAIMVFHRQVGHFSDDALEMVKAIGSQVAIAINNAQLYELIRDQAERLGSMLRQQQVEASRQTAILEAVADGVVVTDSSNYITFINPSAERILNLVEADIKGRPLENFAGLFGKSTHTWTQTIQHWSQNPGSQVGGETFAEQINLENGQVVLVHLAPVTWRNEFLGTVSIFRDITHEVEVDRLKSEFVATVSHELRTPMTSIRGYVDILMMGAAGAMNESQIHFLDIVKSNTERLNILVNDLLDVSRIEAGRVTLSMQLVDMREVADEVIAEVTRRSQEENKPMNIFVKSDKHIARVMADVERVRQVLGNLVDNAYNYTPANGKIEIRLRQANGMVQVDVKDSGIGVPAEHQSRVFERFFRGEDPMVLATPGTGLGLPIVKQLVEMHRGKIWMTSKGIPGEGSTFSFTVPVSKAEE